MFRASKRNVGTEKTDGFLKQYTLADRVLGKGAYAEVRMGRNIATGQEFAIKIIDKKNMSKANMKKLHKEVNIMRNLRHRNVVRVHESFDEPNLFYMVMEYVKGGELFAKIVDEENPFTEEKSREIVLTLARALKYCKEKGVIHRDLKPENILLTTDEEGGEIKLADFNLSKQLDPDEVAFSVLETMCGTPNYVAPEVLSGKPYDYKCDIWSLGVITFLLLSGGYLPFFVDSETGTRDALLRKVKEGKWKFQPAEAWTGVSEEAKDFLRKILVKTPDARYGYEQLMAHEWFKGSGAELQEKIDMSMMMDLNKKRKLLATAKVNQAVNIFAALMDEETDNEDNADEDAVLGKQDMSGIGGLSATFSC